MPLSISRRFTGISTAALVLLAMSSAHPVHAQTVDPLYAGKYTLTNLGSVLGVPTPYGGLTLAFGSTNTLLIGGNANTVNGAIFAIGVTRDAGNHINGFTGTASVFGEGTYNDGGLTYTPDGVLLASRWPVNQLGESKAGSHTTDKIIDLNGAPYNVATSHAALNFVPAGFATTGHVKMVSWGGGQWYDGTLSPDGAGTYNLNGLTQVAGSTLPGGPEGFVYVPTGSALFTTPSLLVSAFSADTVDTYAVDSSGDPIVGSRKTFVSGLTGAEGAFIDPVTGDFLFSTFGGANQVIVVQGFVPPPPTTTVPEPGTVCLAASVLLPILGVTRRRRR